MTAFCNPLGYDDLDCGDSTPASCTPEVDQGFADLAWVKAKGCCDICNESAVIVTTNPQRQSCLLVLCETHFDSLEGATCE